MFKKLLKFGFSEKMNVIEYFEVLEFCDKSKVCVIYRKIYFFYYYKKKLFYL